MTDIESINKRNTRVEADKAWEVSLSRRAIIALGTFLMIGGYLTYLGVENAWLHATFTVIAYLISTLSLHFVKQIWVDKIYKSKEGLSNDN